MEKEAFADELVALFPEKADALLKHYEDYGELLGHIFFAEEINVPLFLLLQKHTEIEKIKIYCSFIEKMWTDGSAYVQNIVDVTIAERLSDEETVWFRFGDYISVDFKRYLNDCLLKENLMMQAVPKLQ